MTLAQLTHEGWVESPIQLPVGLASHCMTFVNSTTLMIFGGYTDAGFSDSSYYFHFTSAPSQNSLVPGPPLLKARMGMG